MLTNTPDKFQESVQESQESVKHLWNPQGQKCPPGGTATAPAGAHHRHPTKNLPPEIKISQASPDLLRFHLDNRVANSFLLINYTSLTDGNIPTPFHNKLFQ